MELFEALFNRRSIRKYTGEKVSKEDTEKIIEAAMYAPSAVNKQPWHFLVFSDLQLIEEIIRINPNAMMLKSAGQGILVCYDKLLQHAPGYGPVDCSAATQNLLLAAHGLNLGACWIGIYPRQERVEALNKLFDLPEQITTFSIVSIGHTDVIKERPERINKERIHWNQW